MNIEVLTYIGRIIGTASLAKTQWEMDENGDFRNISSIMVTMHDSGIPATFIIGKLPGTFDNPQPHANHGDTLGITPYAITVRLFSRRD